jgi:hypothetical protein
MVVDLRVAFDVVWTEAPLSFGNDLCFEQFGAMKEKPKWPILGPLRRPTSAKRILFFLPSLLLGERERDKARGDAVW